MFSDVLSVMAINWDWNTVAHYEDNYTLSKSGEYVELTVSTNYGDFEEYQSIRYDFLNSDPEILEGLEEFRSEEGLPAIIAGFRGYPSISLMRPENDRVEAVEVAEELKFELDEFLLNNKY